MLGCITLLVSLKCVRTLGFWLQKRAAFKLTTPSCFIFEDAVLLNGRLLDGIYFDGPKMFSLLEDKRQYPDAPLLTVYVNHGMGSFGDFIIPLPDGEDATLKQARSIVQSFDDGYKGTITYFAC